MAEFSSLVTSSLSLSLIFSSSFFLLTKRELEESTYVCMCCIQRPRIQLLRGRWKVGNGWKPCWVSSSPFKTSPSRVRESERAENCCWADIGLRKREHLLLSWAVFFCNSVSPVSCSGCKRCCHFYCFFFCSTHFTGIDLLPDCCSFTAFSPVLFFFRICVLPLAVVKKKYIYI